MHREFLKARRKEHRFPHYALDDVHIQLPSIPPQAVERLDGTRVLQALARPPEPYQAPLVLFYLGEHSYTEIADILGIPIGTVQSRIARGKMQLQRMLAAPAAERPKRARRG